MLAGFKTFIMRGNVIDLAVGIVIGAAFGAVVTAFVENIINPLIAGIFGQPDLTRVLAWTISEAQGDVPANILSIGAFLGAVLNFLIVAAAIYFAVVLPLNTLAERRKATEVAEPEAPAADVALLTEIRDLLAAPRS
ncbi:large conductance mechanosensitive channel protein MscL [Actinotalea sp.]|uniref:large conductance mechanosensitive channel protein MscL n=1 Tax=Actinotalea sp. TaxID=1872145 RepID=UPI0035621E58